MSGLRWRIAAWYAVLLIGAIAVILIAIGFTFNTILYDQAKERIDRIEDDIARVAGRPEIVLGLGEFPVIQELLNPNNLQHWASPNTFIQVDNGAGYPLGKSSNMGAEVFPPNTTLGASRDRFFRILNTSLGELLVEDRFIVVAGRQVAIVHVGQPFDLVRTTFQRTSRTLVLIFLVAVGAVIALSFLLASRAIKPIGELTAAMQEIGSDRLDRRLKWTGRDDEIGRLASTFDEMIARLEEAFARERQFISDASHELKTPLTVINANAQLLRRWADADPALRDESLAAITAQSASLAQMVNGMLTLAKADSGEQIAKEPIPLADLVSEVVRAAEPRALAKSLQLRVSDSSAGAQVFGNTNLIRQLVVNLVDNAMKFTDRGEIQVRVMNSAGNPSLEVRDSGTGIEPHEAQRIFERFYRTDKSRSKQVEGTGLGLAIVRSIARVHGGSVEAESRPGGGSVFRVTFPAYDPERDGQTVI